MADPIRSPFSRVFTLADRAGPAAAPIYQGQVRAQALTLGFGDRTRITEPDPDQYGQFQTIDFVKGEADLPTLGLQARYQFTKDEFIRLARAGCPIDVQVHFGKCQDPRDFNGGWDKVLILESADFSSITTDDLGALAAGEDAIVNEAIDLSGLDAYEIKKLSFGELAAAAITKEVIDVSICDSPTCGVCGVTSDGCQHVFAIQLRDAGSPGLPAELIASADGGATIIQSNIDSLGATLDPSAIDCVGRRVAVLSNVDLAVHYADQDDILAATDTWTKNAAGIVAAKGPNDIFSRGTAFTWVVGDGGYIYFYNDITGTPVVQSAGSVTTQNLNAVHFYDDLNGVAVGASNAVVFTTNGGTTWTSVTGPAVGVALNTVWMRSAAEWFIGTAGGRLYYTRNSGSTWTEKAFPGSGAGVVYDIQFATPTVGYLAHTTAAPLGRILRTIDGGASWYVLPEGTGSLPDNDRIVSVVGCASNPDVVFGGGLAANGTDGIFMKGA